MEYFNPLFSTPIFAPEGDIIFASLKNIPTKFVLDPERPCSTDRFYKDYRSPLTLRQICLKFLHFELAFKRRIGSKIIFNNALSPQVYETLAIPLTLKRDLLRLFRQCHRHCKLSAMFCPSEERYLKKIILVPGTPLFLFIETECIEHCFRAWSPEGLLSFVQTRQNFPLQLVHSRHLRNYVLSKTRPIFLQLEIFKY